MINIKIRTVFLYSLISFIGCNTVILPIYSNQKITKSTQNSHISSQKQGIQAKIAACVNQNPISDQDIDAMIRLKLMQSGLSYTPENSILLRPGSIKDLVEIFVKKQICDEVGIPEAPENLEHLASQNNKTIEAVEADLRKQNIDIKMLKMILEVNKRWALYIRSKYQNRVQVSIPEIQEWLKKWHDTQNQIQFDLDEIEFTGPNNVSIAQKLYDQMKAGRKNFNEILRQPQISNLKIKTTGWVGINQLDLKTRDNIESLSIGSVSRPISYGAQSCKILYLKDKREPGKVSKNNDLVQIGQIILPKNHPNVADIKSTLHELRGWTALSNKAKGYELEVHSQPNLIPVRALPVDLQNKINMLPEGGQIILDQDVNYYVFLVVCKREAPAPLTPPTQEEAKDALEQDKFMRYSASELKQLMAVSYQKIYTSNSVQ